MVMRSVVDGAVFMESIGLPGRKALGEALLDTFRREEEGRAELFRESRELAARNRLASRLLVDPSGFNVGTWLTGVMFDSDEIVGVTAFGIIVTPADLEWQYWLEYQASK